MAQLLAGKTALVLGVANKWSIAYAISSAFVREGGSLVLTYQGERQRQTVEELGSELKAASVLNCDVRKSEDIEHLVSELKQSSSVIDTVVHSIAFAEKDDLSRPFLETSRDGFLLAQEVSAYSLVSVSRALTPLMTKGGSITTLTYLGSTRVVQNYNVMGVAKAALEACVRYLASELGVANIRVNAISAGPIKTASARGIKDFSKVLDGVAATAPLRRNTDAGEVADTAVFLASDLGRGVTGNIVFVDAGFHIMGWPHTNV
jgi:enoyl-[acyl-carrier protein] reductase I